MRVGFVFGAMDGGGLGHMCGGRMECLRLDSKEGSSALESYTHLDVCTGEPND